MSPALEGSPVFATTQWGLIANWRKGSAEEAQSALADLCRTYWPPIYVYLRRHGYAIEDAEDLTQGFFAWIVDKDWLQRVDQTRGKFRAILLTSLKNFVRDAGDRAKAAKRGGEAELISLDAQAGEAAYQALVAKELSPSQAYDVQWASSLIEQTLETLHSNYREEGKEELFSTLRSFLTNDPQLSYEDAANKLGISGSALKATIYRLRQRYATTLRAAIAETLSDPSEVDAEIGYLCSVLS
jgi:RNA polymerase sigma factor (sigma-70 family)